MQSFIWCRIYWAFIGNIAALYVTVAADNDEIQAQGA